MEQHFHSPVDQVAGNNIYNIYIHLKNKDVDISDLSLADMLSIVEYVKQENKLITKKQYLNTPSILIALITFYLLFQPLSGMVTLVSGGFLNGQLSRNNLSTYTLLLSLFFIIICVKWLYNKTKYLNPIRLENNKIIYDLELEIEKRKLRGEDKT